MTKEHAKEFVDKHVSDNTVAVLIIYKYEGGEFRSVLSDGSGKYSLDAEYMRSSDTVFKYLADHPWNTSRDSVPEGMKGDELWLYLSGKYKDKDVCQKDG